MKLFISHASEDKDEVARPLAEQLSRLGYSVWYDEYTLKVGRSLSEEIDRGLAACDYGILILSPSFFAKNWPKRELAGLVAREVIEDRHVLLPIWHRVGVADVARHSLPLADRLAVETTGGLDRVVSELCRSIGQPVHDPQRKYLELAPADRASKIATIMSIYCGDKGDLMLLLEAAAFLEIAAATEEDEVMRSEICRAQQHVDEQARLVAEEMKQDNPE
jgi:hypothetical protein